MRIRILVGLAALLISGPALATDFKVFIPAQTTATAPYGATDYFPLIQGGATKKIPGNSIATLTDAQTFASKTLTSPTINAGALSGTFTGTPTFSGSLTLSGGAALSGTFSGTPTFSGNLTFSGVPVLSGIGTGTIVSGGNLGLDSSNNIVKATVSGGGGSSTVTANGNTETAVTTFAFGTGFSVPGGSSGTAAITRTNALNTQSGTGAYAIVAGDAIKQILRTNASGGADTIANATGTLGDGYATLYTTNAFAGNTITATTALINGLASIKLGAYQSAGIASISGNYHADLSVPQPATQTGTTVLADTMLWQTPAALLDNIASTQGDILYRGASAWVALAPGSSGQFLKTQGAAANPVWATVSGGSGCATTGTIHNVLYDDGAGGCTSDASANLTLGALTLGASGTAGSVAMGNATSGTVTLQPVTGALGSVTASLPANTGTIAELNLAQSWTAAQTLTAAAPQLILGVNTSTLGSVKMFGNTSGDLTVRPAAVAGTSTVLQVPAWGATGNVAAIDVAQTFSASQTFGETHGTTYAPTLTSNNYNVLTTDCGKTLLIPTGTTPTVTMPNLNASCTVVLVQASATQFTVQAASGGTIHSVNSYTKSKAQYAMLFLTIIVPSASVAEWSLGGDGA